MGSREQRKAHNVTRRFSCITAAVAWCRWVRMTRTSQRRVVVVAAVAAAAVAERAGTWAVGTPAGAAACGTVADMAERRATRGTRRLVHNAVVPVDTAACRCTVRSLASTASRAVAVAAVAVTGRVRLALACDQPYRQDIVGVAVGGNGAAVGDADADDVAVQYEKRYRSRHARQQRRLHPCC